MPHAVKLERPPHVDVDPRPTHSNHLPPIDKSASNGEIEMTYTDTYTDAFAFACNVCNTNA